MSDWEYFRDEHDDYLRDWADDDASLAGLADAGFYDEAA